MDNTYSQDLGELVLAFLAAETWNESKQIVESHPELLTDQDRVGAIFDQLAHSAIHNPEAIRDLIEHRELLDRCREHGIEMAFFEHAGIRTWNWRWFIRWTRPLVYAAVALAAVVFSLVILVKSYGLSKILIGAALVSSIGILISLFLWQRIWRKGMGDPVPLDIKIFIIRAALLEVTGDWGLFQIKRNDSRKVEIWIQALERAKRRNSPRLVASIEIELGNALRSSQTRDRAGDLSRAVSYYEQALQAIRRERNPDDWAKVHLNLASAYRERSRIMSQELRLANILQALEHMQSASQVLENDAFQHEFAALQLDLADTLLEIQDTFWRSGEPEVAVNQTERAEEICVSVLEMKSLYQSDLQLWARAQSILGSIYRQKTTGDREDGLLQAVQHYRQALQAYAQSAYPEEDCPRIHELLALTYSSLYQTRQKEEDWIQAVYHLQFALDDLHDGRERDSARVASSLASLYFGAGHWLTAHRLYQLALEATQVVFNAAYTELGRRLEAGWIDRLYTQAAYCLLMLGHPSDAFTRLEQGKTRLLAEVLASEETIRLPKERREALQQARHSVRSLETELRLSSDTSAHRSVRALAEQLRQARADLNQLINAIRQDHSNFMPLGLTLPGILALIPEDGVLVAPLITSQGSAVFVVLPGVETITEEHVVRLGEYKDEILNALLVGTEGDPGWLYAYRSGDRLTWETAIETTTRQLWQELMLPIHERLQQFGVRRVILMPSGGLQLLPLHAAWRMENGVRRYFIDDYEVSCAPSAFVLKASHERAASRSGHTALVAGVSEYKQFSPLHFTHIEVEEIGQLFQSQPLIDNAATLEAVRQSAGGAAYLHLSCHGSFAWGGDPLASALYLADDEPLTLSVILGKMDLNSTRLVTLSACETGISDVRQSPDEYIGLPAGFLQAGAAGVVSSLWSVNDLSTALLMVKFYEAHLKEGLAPAAALRKAQLWLRDVTNVELSELFARYKLSATDRPASTRMAYEMASEKFREHTLRDPNERPYAHPYYWAPFVFYGV